MKNIKKKNKKWDAIKIIVLVILGLLDVALLSDLLKPYEIYKCTNETCDKVELMQYTTLFENKTYSIKSPELNRAWLDKNCLCISFLPEMSIDSPLEMERGKTRCENKGGIIIWGTNGTNENELFVICVKGCSEYKCWNYLVKVK